MKMTVDSQVDDFTLLDQDGQKVSLQGAFRNQNVLLVFYRGYW